MDSADKISTIVEHVDMETLEKFCECLYFRDSYTAMHAEHVAELMAGLASQMGFNSSGVNLAYMVGVMHDVGKIQVPLDILTKPGRLTEEEFQMMQFHTVAGEEMLNQVDGLEPVAVFARHHHERYDGRGYPDGLKGKDIPLLSRMLAICDSFDAMTTKRCYRTPVALDECLREIKNCAGSQFDPDVCQHFQSFVKIRFGVGGEGPQSCIDAAG